MTEEIQEIIEVKPPYSRERMVKPMAPGRWSRRSKSARQVVWGEDKFGTVLTGSPTKPKPKAIARAEKSKSKESYKKLREKIRDKQFSQS